MAGTSFSSELTITVHVAEGCPTESDSSSGITAAQILVEELDGLKHALKRRLAGLYNVPENAVVVGIPEV